MSTHRRVGEPSPPQYTQACWCQPALSASSGPRRSSGTARDCGPLVPQISPRIRREHSPERAPAFLPVSLPLSVTSLAQPDAYVGQIERLGRKYGLMGRLDSIRYRDLSLKDVLARPEELAA